MEKEQEFNLVYEPWIKVTDSDYHVQTVSLKDAILQAEQFRGLTGETETQNISVLRFILAVLHTVFSRQDETGQVNKIDTPAEARRRWKAIWDAGKFPEKPINEYLDKWQDRFWLFDPKYPFYQSAGLVCSGHYSANKMNGELVESNHKTNLFSLRMGKGRQTLSYAEAARWLLRLHAYDDTAAKNPGPKKCHVSNLGMIFARGNTLFETLMLNLTMLKDGIEVWGEAKPAWEREDLFFDKQRELPSQIPVPDNQPEILTMQCRTVILSRNNGVVTDYWETAGEFIDESNAFEEQMTFWKKTKQKNQTETETFPQKNDKPKQLWRDLSSLFGTTENGQKPGVVAWVEMLRTKQMIPKNKFVAFETIGVNYGANTCSMNDEFSDFMDFNTSLFDDIGRAWQVNILNEIERCDKLASAVGLLALRIDKAMGGNGENAENEAKSQAYYQLDIPFRQWIHNIDTEWEQLEEKNAYIQKWRNTAVEIIRRLGREIVSEANYGAIAGRSVSEKIKGKKEMEQRNYNVPEAYNYFSYQLKQIGGEHNE